LSGKASGAPRGGKEGTKFKEQWDKLAMTMDVFPFTFFTSDRAVLVPYYIAGYAEIGVTVDIDQANDAIRNLKNKYAGKNKVNHDVLPFLHALRLNRIH